MDPGRNDGRQPPSSTPGGSPNWPSRRGDDLSPTIDGVALASLLFSLTCFGAPFGLVLGVIGLVRTKGQSRRGRWAAATGAIVGLLATLVPVIYLWDLLNDPRPFKLQ